MAHHQALDSRRTGKSTRRGPVIPEPRQVQLKKVTPIPAAGLVPGQNADITSLAPLDRFTKATKTGRLAPIQADVRQMRERALLDGTLNRKLARAMMAKQAPRKGGVLRPHLGPLSASLKPVYQPAPAELGQLGLALGLVAQTPDLTAQMRVASPANLQDIMREVSRSI